MTQKLIAETWNFHQIFKILDSEQSKEASGFTMAFIFYIL